MITERVDDIPVLIGELEKSELSNYLDQYFPDHGNWQGLSGGKVTVGFLTFLLSCSDHRLNRVESWVKSRLHTFRHCLDNQELTEKDFTDDRLGALLDRYSDEKQWQMFEQSHNANMLKVYDLSTKDEAIRLDAMIVQSFRAEGENFKKGHSKQHRSDLPQLKAMVATLDPLSMPLHSVIVSGNRADDPLYLEAIAGLNPDLLAEHQLFVGDAKLGSFDNRSSMQQQGYRYLCPLSKNQCSAVQLASYLEQRPTELVVIEEATNDLANPAAVKAKAFEIEEQRYCKKLDLTWTERRLVVYSRAYAESLMLKFDHRIDKTVQQLNELLIAKQGKKKLETIAAIKNAVATLLKKNRVTPFFKVTISSQVEEIAVRKYGNRPAGIRQQISFSLQFELNTEAIEQHRQNLGWRVYATNCDQEKMTTKDCILCYRQEYRIEHKFNELLNKFTALVPVYLQKDHRVKTLIRLSLLALKFVSTIQHQVRKGLKDTGQKIKELYPGNSGRATAKPTTKMILEAFQNIDLVILPFDNQTIIKVSRLKPVQLQLLKLLGLKSEIFTDLEQISFSGFDLGET